MRFFIAPLTLALAACGSSAPPPGVCAPGAEALELTGEVLPADAKTYRMLPFRVHPDTARVELSYQWTEKDGAPVTPLSATTLDLGLWDQRGYRSQDAFRGWGGSRQGRIDQGDPPIFVQADSADRGFTPGEVRPGLWHAELGIAAVSPQGADYVVRVQCRAAAREPLPVADGVDAAHVANAAPGWYYGDFHMHAYHSNPEAPDWPEFVSMARDAQLDFLMVTEYVTGAHWDTLGAVQRANPDLVIWPGREVITYFGHANTHGETPGLYDYRHGFEDVELGWIQAEAKARGALFQVNHPRIFPPPAFANFCRGCYFELDDAIDWNLVDLVEVVNGPVLATAEDAGAPPTPGSAENPFLQASIDYWEERLAAGFKVTAVSGSDSKGTEPDAAERARRGYGSSATAVYAENLSRAALTAALQAGHAYIRARGVAGSPALEFVAIAPDASEGMFGDTLVVGPTDAVTLRTTVTGGAGQVLRYLRNGEMFAEVAIPTDPFMNELVVTRDALSEGPLGTFWGIETLDAQTRTTIGNPVFLKGP
jgi:hypothetical protein